jgi:hypothetical protein
MLSKNKYPVTLVNSIAKKAIVTHKTATESSKITA